MSEPALEVRGLTRTYGKRKAVASLDLTVEQGDVYGFLGPNGAGKTTAIRCILGLIQPDRGDVAIFGQRAHPARLDAVGAIVETPAFYTWMTGRENLEVAAAYRGMGARKAGEEIARVLDRVGLAERASDKSGGYSLGMKQRLAIARALLGRPKLLILDEPTNGLDPRGMREVRDLVRSLALHDGITVFLSSHLLAEIQAICNRVGILQEGEMRAEGKVDELLAAHVAQRFAVEVGADPDALAAAVEAIEGATITGPGASGRQRLELTGLDVPGLNKALVEAGVEVTALVPQERNLEEVFLEVTR